MRLSDPAVIGSVFALSELALLLFRRAGGTRATDRGSLGRIWGVIGAAIALAVAGRIALPQADSALLERLSGTGGVLFVLGLALRAWAIVHLGRYFTVDVAVAEDQPVIDTGPYRFIRHPSYSGALLEFFGYAITFGNWLSLALLLPPVWLIFLYRMRIEEQALCAGIGEPYLRYMSRTKRLIPGLY